MDKAQFTIIDHADMIEVPGDVFAHPANEYWALISLRQGLEFLRKQVEQCDRVVKQRVNPDDKLHVFIMGNDPVLRDIPQGLLTCAFEWYAIAACKYVRTVGAIAYKLGKTELLPNQYADRIIPEVIAFRNKVAAHSAWTTMHTKDNAAEREVSIMPQLAFENDSFVVGRLTLARRTDGKSSDSSSIQPWSIRSVHEKLRRRYWPSTKKKISQQSRTPKA